MENMDQEIEEQAQKVSVFPPSFLDFGCFVPTLSARVAVINKAFIFGLFWPCFIVKMAGLVACFMAHLFPDMNEYF